MCVCACTGLLVVCVCVHCFISGMCVCAVDKVAVSQVQVNWTVIVAVSQVRIVV